MATYQIKVFASQIGAYHLSPRAFDNMVGNEITFKGSPARVEGATVIPDGTAALLTINDYK